MLKNTLNPFVSNNFSSKIQHGFFGRAGGVSEGLFSSLNCGPGSQDDPAAVQENRLRICQHFQAPYERLFTLHQIHSAQCFSISAPFDNTDPRPQGDALATDRPGFLLGILTADCGPILFEGQKSDGAPVIGAAHAGWGGALKGVAEQTVKAMILLGAKLETIKAAVGPCIGPKSYEVSVGFEKPFLDLNPDDDHFFKPARLEGHLMFDLPGYIAARLSRFGLKDVALSDLDTFSKENDYFSFRRTTHRKEADYGRQISAIMIP